MNMVILQKTQTAIFVITGILIIVWSDCSRVQATASVQKGDQDAQATLGLHFLGQNIHWWVENHSLERHWCWKHGHGMQEVLQGKHIHNVHNVHTHLPFCNLGHQRIGQRNENLGCLQRSRAYSQKHADIVESCGRAAESSYPRSPLAPACSCYKGQLCHERGNHTGWPP